MADTAQKAHSRCSQLAESRAAAGSQQRIDLAHTVPGPGTSDDVPITPSPDDQAAELAELLFARQTSLDRREAELNAEQAEFEKEVRAARLWVQDRQDELLERERALPVQPTATDDDGVAAQQPSWDRVAAELEAREQALSDRELEAALVEEDAAARRQEVERQAATLDEDREGLAAVETAIAERESVLEDRHREIDLRQAQLYRDIEQFTSERVRLADQQAAVDARRADLGVEVEQLQTREAQVEHLERETTLKQSELEAAMEVLATRSEVLAQREEELEDRESQVAFRHREIETALARFERLSVTEVKMEDLREKAITLENRSAFLDQAEAVLADEQADLAAEKQENDAQRLAFEQDAERRRRQIATQQTEAEAELIQKRRSLERREQEADHREATLDQLQAELECTQREVLEMRLGTEEIFAQLSGALAPASLSRSIAQTRERISEQYHLRENDLECRRREIVQVQDQVAAEHEQLIAKRGELDAWIRRRQQDVEAQAARLVAREKELDRQETHFADLERQWAKQRGDQQQEIRRLLAALRRPETAAA